MSFHVVTKRYVLKEFEFLVLSGIVDKKDSQRSQGNNSNGFEHMNDVQKPLSVEEKTFLSLCMINSPQVGNHDIVQFIFLVRLSTSIFIYGKFYS